MNVAACNWHVICYHLNAVTEGEGSTDTYIDCLNKAVMVALVDALLTELLISQNTTAEHVACMKQIVGEGDLRGISVERQHEAEYLNSTFSFSTAVQNISFCQPVNQVTRKTSNQNQSNKVMKHSSY